MALIKSVKGIAPVIGQHCFLADNATITGDVVIGDHCTVWFNAVIRGDVHHIRIGNHVNIQDGVIIHCTYQKAPVSIGNRVSIAHNAIIHGCTIHDNVLIGMGAIIMDHAVIESNSVIAAGAVVLKGTEVKSGSIYAGVPAQLIRTADTGLVEGEIHRIAENYTMYASWYNPDLREDDHPDRD
ncbi:MAG: gamma carbonic anhydrase family protein [Bacteroidales bacterium]|nr:gamma carbonic anhydrase family protein [Bacteroidales bacterium]